MRELPDNFELTKEFAVTFDQIENGEQNLFITGNGGVGKTTFLDYFCNTTRKNYAVVAPTGVAALRSGGKTLHSFFNFPLKFLLEDDVKISRSRDVIEYMDVLIIDEVSMVRADVLDAIDWSLKLHRGSNKPFGGIQIVLIGDLFQLPPVVTDDTREVLAHRYGSKYFFDAKVMENVDLKLSNFTKVFRQRDVNFLSLLDRIRWNKATDDDIAKLNTLTQPFSSNEKGVLVLTSRNKDALRINTHHLNKLTTPTVTYPATVLGNFSPSEEPVDRELSLKVGAQVMICKNDPNGRWVNGSLAEVTRLEPDHIEVIVNGEPGSITRSSWEKFEYMINAKKGVESKATGMYTQFPIKLAWATTIHKSQGQTLDKVIIDLGSGAFEHGQTYVALSRCRTFEGIRLNKKCTYNDIRVDKCVTNYMRTLTCDTQAVG